MLERTLNLQQLGLSANEVIEAIPDGHLLRQEISSLLQQIDVILQARFAFTTTGIDKLEDFQPGRIIQAQLQGSEALCWFVATAGEGFEAFMQQVKEEGDMVKLYLTNEIGSMIAEKTADRMEELLQDQLTPKGLHRTNRFSPGYCGWGVNEQPKLFRLFPPEPCGIRLTDSCLMLPIKSVSGVIGIGHIVKRLEYTCGICQAENCYKKRKH